MKRLDFRVGLAEQRSYSSLYWSISIETVPKETEQTFLSRPQAWVCSYVASTTKCILGEIVCLKASFFLPNIATHLARSEIRSMHVNFVD